MNAESFAGRLDGIDSTMRSILRALVALDARLNTHTDLLELIAKAATAEGPEGDESSKALAAIAANQETQTDLLAGIATAVGRLPDLTADAVEARVDAAMPAPDGEGRCLTDVLTYRTLAAGAPSEAAAYAAHLLEKTLDDEEMKLAAYYGRYEEATRDALDLDMGSIPLMRPDTDQALVDALGAGPDRLIEERALANLLGGRRADGEELAVNQATVRVYEGREAGTSDRHRISGVDFCISAPKSVSLAWMAAADDGERSAILQAHRQANAEALRYVESEVGVAYLDSGRQGGTERARMTWISVDHYTARSTLDVVRTDPTTGAVSTEIHTVTPGGKIAGDPQLHTHNFVPNVMVSESGRLVAMNRNLLNMRIKEFGAVYQAILARNLRAIGIDVALDDRTGMARIPCIPEAACEEFSKRTRDGEAAARAEAAKRGLDWDAMDAGSKVAFIKGGTLASRKFKADDLANAAAWRAGMERIGWRHTSAMQYGPAAPERDAADRHAAAHKVATEVLDPELQRRAVMSGYDLRAAAARGLIAEGMRDTSEVGVITQMMARLGVRQDGRLTPIEWRAGPDGSARVTTALHKDQEAELIRLARSGAADREGALTVEEMRAAVHRLGVKYSGQTGREQIDVVKTVGQAGRVAAFIGAAGTGKTSRILPPMVEAWRAKGRDVFGVSLAWRQAAALEEAGIARRNTFAMQPFLDRITDAATAKAGEGLAGPPPVVLTRNSVVVIDELSQIGTRQLLHLLQKREKIGFTLVMTGDPWQCAAVESGPVIELLRKALGDEAVPQVLTVVRQATEREREIASLFRGKDDDSQATRLRAVTKALAMKREDRSAEMVDGGYRAAVARVAALYMERAEALREHGRAVTVSVPTNAEALDVSRDIRALRRAAGEVGRDVAHRPAMDGAGNAYTLALAPGDRVRLFQRTRGLFGAERGQHSAVVGNNGSVLTVREVRRDGLLLETAKGKVGFVAWKGFRERGAGEDGRLRLAYGDCLTIDSAQGITSDEHIMALPNGLRGVQGLKGYVAASRHRHRSWLVVSKGMELREVADRRPLNAAKFADPAAEEKALWANTARNLARMDVKETAHAMLGLFREGAERAGAVLRDAAIGQQARERSGAAPTRLRAAFRVTRMRAAVVEMGQRMERAMQARAPLMQRLATLARRGRAQAVPVAAPEARHNPAQPGRTPAATQGEAAAIPPPPAAPRRVSPRPQPPRAILRRVEVSEADAAGQLADALRSHGLMLKTQPVFDGRIHYVGVEGNRGAEKSGAYKARPHATFGYVASIWNWKSHGEAGFAGHWRANGEAVTISPEEAARRQADEAAKAEARAKERVVREARSAVVAQRVVDRAEPAKPEHPYLVAKGIGVPEGVLENRKGELVLPLRDGDGRVRSVQTIAPDGSKLYMKGAQKIGVFGMLGQPEDGKTILVTEGLATAETVRRATGHPVAVALDTGGLMAAGLALREKYPASLIIFAADNDHHLPRRAIPLINAGVEKATRAAAEVGGRVLVPPELPERANAMKGTDWNDVHALRGLDAVRDALRSAWRATETPTVQAKAEPLRAEARQSPGMRA